MTTDWLQLSDKVCAITGANGGLGQALARAFAAQGARVALLDRTIEGLDALAEKIVTAGGHAPLLVACDVSDEAAVKAAADQVQAALGAADVLVNNAALLRPGALDELAITDWNQQIAVNLTGYYLCARAFGAQMTAKGQGALVHVASISASNPQDRSGAYSVTKAGVLMLSRQLANEWGPRGVRSNVVSPGMVETPMSAAFYADPVLRQKREGVVPLRRIGQPPDIADAALFLASPRAAYITGEDILVDGGYANMLMNLVPRPGY